MKKTFTYKSITGCDIKGDFYPTDETNAPLIMYIHGGGLIWGTREDVHKEQIALYNQHGFHFCSIDYRLHQKVNYRISPVTLRTRLFG